MLVYDHIVDDWKEYLLESDEPMPFVHEQRLLVHEFLGRSHSSVLWSDRRALEAFDTLCSAWGMPLQVDYAFRRIGEAVHLGQSQHYAGMAFDLGRRLQLEERVQLRALAVRIRAFHYVEPSYLTPTWVHVETRVGDMACTQGAYPILEQGDAGTHVFVLQDVLCVLGFYSQGLTGYFTPTLRAALIRFQRAHALPDHGKTDCATWQCLMQQAAQCCPHR